MEETDFYHNRDGFEKPPHAPDHPYWDKTYRQKTESYRSDALRFVHMLYGAWVEKNEQMTPADVAVELAVLKARNRGPYQDPKESDKLTLYDLYAASTWNDALNQATLPDTYNAMPVELLHARERRERFAELVLDAYLNFEHPDNEPLPSWIQRDMPPLERTS